MFRSRKNKPGDGNSYEKKSNRIYAWSDFLRSASKILWVLVFIIILVGVGKTLLFKSDKSEKMPITIKKPVVTKVEWSKVNQKIREVMKKARDKSEKEASAKLDEWINSMMERVDKDFLEWYFSYWTQQKMGLKSLLYQVLNWVDSDNPTPAERITQEVQEEFSNRVLRPQIAQMEIERILNEIVSNYSTSLNEKLQQIPNEYKIKRAEWERYLSDIAVIVKNVEANRQTPITLKALAGATAGGMVLMFRSIRPIISKIGSRVSAKLATKTASKMASKTGGKVAAKVGGKFLGTIIAVGIIIWDVWDHYATKKKALPVLRDNIFDYFKEVKESLLHDPEHGIMTIIYEMETNISKQFKSSV